MKTVGSQTSEKLVDSEYDCISYREKAGELILIDTATGQQSLWVRNDDFAGYVIKYMGHGFEFVRDITA